MSTNKELIQKILKAKTAKEIARDSDALELVKLISLLFRAIKSETGQDEWSNNNMTSFTDARRYPVAAAFLKKGHHWMLILRFYPRTQNVLVYDSRFSEGRNIVLHKVTANEQIVISEVMWKYLKQTNKKKFSSTHASNGQLYSTLDFGSTASDPIGGFKLLAQTNYSLNFGNSIMAQLQADNHNCGPISIFAGIIANQETSPRTPFHEMANRTFKKLQEKLSELTGELLIRISEKEKKTEQTKLNEYPAKVREAVKRKPELKEKVKLRKPEPKKEEVKLRKPKSIQEEAKKPAVFKRANLRRPPTKKESFEHALNIFLEDAFEGKFGSSMRKFLSEDHDFNTSPIISLMHIFGERGVNSQTLLNWIKAQIKNGNLPVELRKSIYRTSIHHLSTEDKRELAAWLKTILGKR